MVTIYVFLKLWIRRGNACSFLGVYAKNYAVVFFDIIQNRMRYRIDGALVLNKFQSQKDVYIYVH